MRGIAAAKAYAAKIPPERRERLERAFQEAQEKARFHATYRRGL